MWCQQNHWTNKQEEKKNTRSYQPESIESVVQLNVSPKRNDMYNKKSCVILSDCVSLEAVFFLVIIDIEFQSDLTIVNRDVMRSTSSISVWHCVELFLSSLLSYLKKMDGLRSQGNVTEHYEIRT